MEPALFVEFISLGLVAAQATPVEPNQGTDVPEKGPRLQIVAETPVVDPQYWAQQCKPWDDWEKAGPPFKVHGNTYYVGTCGITSLLIKTKDGRVLIDTGTEDGVWQVYRNITRMRENPASVGLILYSHEHFDHVGGLAWAQGFTFAPVVAPSGTANVFRTGKDDPRDPQAGMHEPMRPAPHVIEIDLDKPLTYGGIDFTPIGTPGHTPGALTWQWESCEENVCKTIVYADSLSPISHDDYKFSEHPEYLAAYRKGIEKLRGLKCDILLTPHPSHSKMVERAATGTLEGGMTCAEYADAKTKALDERLAKEAASE